ncbi:MAG: twin-arginine translocation signal domain-containing protein [Fimbriimonadaceae bacterium]|nr:twin-arginine translocation signal domain-containing protein [Fimbriimonadaceae bacterium]
MRMTRRDFLKASAATTLAASPMARALAQGGSGLVLGSGEFRYECVHDWLTPPPGMAFGDTHGVAQDSQGRIYVAHTVHGSSKSSDAICVYTEKGKFLRSWGSQFKGGAHGLDIRREGTEEFIYHCDVAHRKFSKTTLDGTVIWEIDAPKESDKYAQGEAFIPTNVAFSPNGDFYVADGYGSNWIHHYDRSANYLKSFGGRGNAPGRVAQPHGLWLDNRGREPLLAVADRGNRRIQYFSLDGEHHSFSTAGMRLPCHFSIRDGVMLVPDLESVITLLDPQNKPIVHLGDGAPSGLRDKPRAEFIPGKFIHPHDAMFLRNGDILVAEWVPIGRVTLLRRIFS